MKISVLPPIIPTVEFKDIEFYQWFDYCGEKYLKIEMFSALCLTALKCAEKATFSFTTRVTPLICEEIVFRWK